MVFDFCNQNNNIMKILLTFIFTALISVSIFAQEETKADYKLLDNIAVSQSIYSVYAKSEDQKFTLKLCKKDTCTVTQEYTKAITSELLTSDVLTNIKTYLDDTLDMATVTDDQKTAIGKLIEKLKASDLSALKASKTELENILYTVDNEKDQYSAKVILNKHIPYYIKYKDTPPSKAESVLMTLNNTSNDSILANVSKDSLVNILKQVGIKNNTSDPTKKEVKGTGTLEILDAKIQFFNNKASSIYIKAILTVNGVSEKLIFENNSFSVALRYFNKYGSTVSVQNKNRDDIIIDYNDVFDYESDQFFNYSIANSQVSLSSKTPEEQSVQVIQRRFFDFFTGIVYTDVMGFNTENSNSILNTQAKLLLPLNLRNWKKLTLTRQFVTTANIALNNSFEDESRFIAISDDDTFSNFDLLRKNNLYGKIQLDVLTYESKGWFLNTSLGYSAGFYRTGFRYTQTLDTETDIVTSRQLLSVGHGPYLNFEIRPQTNFGADIFISLEDLNYNDTKSINNRSFKNDIIVDGGKNNFGVKYNLVNVEANFYWLTSPEKSKGGIYAKIGSYYHTENHSIYPQIMVGYATNLTSFVNRFKPKAADNVTKPE